MSEQTQQMKVLVINSGSSSIKFELFAMPDQRVEARGVLERIGEQQSRLAYTVAGVHQELERPVADHARGLGLIVEALSDSEHGGLEEISEIGAVGHRVVHGGEAFAQPVVITDEVERAIEEHVQLAPLHNPPNLQGIRVARRLLPGVPQVAVFDTAFHHSIPDYAYVYPVPYELYAEHKVRRYGFHGTSHRYVAGRAAELLGRLGSELNLITAHLGNGCSITAVRRGQSVDTSMGLTPLEGLVMGTRCGDIDPALVAYLERVGGMSIGEIDRLLNKRSGLLGISGVGNDMRELLAAEARGDQRAALALSIYCYRLKKYIGAYTAALGRVDALVFTAGVGEHAATIRERALDRMELLGYRLDPQKNGASDSGARDVAAADSPARILVIPTDEELLIARDTYALACEG
jgi:acetate kinase